MKAEVPTITSIISQDIFLLIVRQIDENFSNKNSYNHILLFSYCSNPIFSSSVESFIIYYF